MERSEKFEQLPKAILAAQKLIGAAEKGSKNPFFGSRYADLGAVMESCKDALNSQGISILQPVGHDTTGDYVETILLHESGEWLSDKMQLNVPKKQVRPDSKKGETFEPYFTPDPQAQGSAITYARRYSLQSMVFIPAEDDDGNTASQRSVAPKIASYVTEASAPPPAPQPARVAPVDTSIIGRKATDPEPIQTVLEIAGAKEDGVAISNVKTSDTKDGTRWYEITDSKGIKRLTKDKRFGEIALAIKGTGEICIFKEHKTDKGNLMIDEMRRLF